MDILTHSLSGVAIGTVLGSYSYKDMRSKIGITMIAGCAAAVPDLDALSLWSKFGLSRLPECVIKAGNPAKIN